MDRFEPKPTQLADRLNQLGGSSPRILLLLPALLGAAILMLSTPHGLGVSDDSVIYLGAARNLVDGNGLSRLEGDGSPDPITHYPPGYPLALATWHSRGGDVETGARLIAALCFFVGIMLVGLLTIDLTQSGAIGFLASSLFALSPVSLEVYTWAMSEPLFVVFVLLTPWLLRRFTVGGRGFLLYASAVTIGLAMITRYIGYTLLLAALIILASQHSPWRKRMADIVKLATICATPMALWLARNLTLTGSATNRQLAWHPVGVNKLKSALLAVGDWVYGGYAPSAWMALPALAIVLAVYTIFIWDRWPRDSGTGPSQRRGLGDLLLPAFTATYIAALLASISLFDYSTPMDRRLLFPLYPPFLVAGVSTIRFLWSRLRGRSFVRVLLAALLLAGTVRYGWETIETADVLRADARGFASQAWQGGPVVGYLRNLPADTAIYTNEPVAVYYLIHQGSYMVPIQFDSVVGRARDDYETAMREMKGRLQSGEAVLVLLDSIEFQTDLAPEEDLIRGLQLVASGSQMRLFVAPP